ncbi:MAG: bifunctional folylpolyglutamate synthase/dihydrofolate synthase [Syntrophus sp. (in: bacteria)]|nr:bifunctional folylpolyglutamate synthase/dihydrofolate synthase [Syntrophus sp. (in: bacteria)]
MSIKKYEKTLKYLFGLEKFGMVFGLDNIRWLLNIIENPHNSFKTVHIAGTNGKGSTATMLSHILKEGGFRVGKYTSPHLVSFTERITVNEEEITEKEVVELTEYIRNKAHEKDKKRFFTFFDFTTALAFEFFKRKKVDIAIIETGLGGRLDSTNVIEPLVSIITNVDYDHMEQLGSRIEQIASEKAGIIKKGIPLVTACEGPAQKIVEGRARELQSQIYILGQDFSYVKTADRTLTYKGIQKNLPDVVVNLDGDHQLTNCALSLCAIEVLSSLGFFVPDDRICYALSHVKWPGRLEQVKENPLVFLDAAHNLHSIHALSQFMNTHFLDKKKILVFGAMKDKEYDKMLDEIVPAMNMVIFTKPNIERALSPHEIKSSVKDAVITGNTRDALERAKTMARKEDLILVTGSFYTIGEAKAIINEIF